MWVCVHGLIYIDLLSKLPTGYAVVIFLTYIKMPFTSIYQPKVYPSKNGTLPVPTKWIKLASTAKNSGNEEFYIVLHWPTWYRPTTAAWVH